MVNPHSNHCATTPARVMIPLITSRVLKPSVFVSFVSSQKLSKTFRFFFSGRRFEIASKFDSNYSRPPKNFRLSGRFHYQVQSGSARGRLKTAGLTRQSEELFLSQLRREQKGKVLPKVTEIKFSRKGQWQRRPPLEAPTPNF